MNQAQLAETVNRLYKGQRWHQTTIGKIENGHRRVEVEDMMLLAAALDVCPMWLFRPEIESPALRVQIGTKYAPTYAEFAAWMQGQRPLPGMDERNFHMEAVRSFGIDYLIQQVERPATNRRPQGGKRGER
jgi:hypothetical protein